METQHSWIAIRDGCEFTVGCGCDHNGLVTDWLCVLLIANTGPLTAGSCVLFVLQLIFSIFLKLLKWIFKFNLDVT